MHLHLLAPGSANCSVDLAEASLQVSSIADLTGVQARRINQSEISKPASQSVKHSAQSALDQRTTL